ncbi:MFS general substrate transporter, partial [Aureobasidium melanogenum]
MGITGDEVHELENTDDLKQATEHTEELVIAHLTEEDVHKLSRESLTLKSRTGWRLAMILFVQGCNQAGYGVDWAVIGGINALPALHAYFGFGYSGSTIGVINALMTIGTVCGAPFLGLADVIGRRGVNFAGNVIVVFAALLQAWARNTEMFMAGRFFMGFGTALMSSSQYMAEISPIHLRGRLVGVFGACFQVGSLGMTGAMIGLTTLEGNYSWRIPLLLQAGLALVVCVTIYLLTPESPRYLVKVGKRDAAKHVVAKYHTTSGNLDEPLVNVVISQIDESLENEKSLAGAWWDYRIFFAKAVRFRMLVLTLYSIFQQWNGGGIITRHSRSGNIPYTVLAVRDRDLVALLAKSYHPASINSDDDGSSINSNFESMPPTPERLYAEEEEALARTTVFSDDSVLDPTESESESQHGAIYDTTHRFRAWPSPKMETLLHSMAKAVSRMPVLKFFAAGSQMPFPHSIEFEFFYLKPGEKQDLGEPEYGTRFDNNDITKARLFWRVPRFWLMSESVEKLWKDTLGKEGIIEYQEWVLGKAHSEVYRE